MDSKIKELKEYMEQSRSCVQDKIDELVNDGRSDEARAYRASFNIFEVFTALIDTSAKISGGDVDRFKTEFHKLAEKIPSGWRRSLEEAKQHDDPEKVMIEEAKLKTADEIISKFDELF
jgi:hypothetical protein